MSIHRRWLAIALPWWPTDLARRRRARADARANAPSPSARDAPLLIHRLHRQAKEVVAVCPHAHTFGARSGMPLAQAKAICGLDAIEIEWTPDADARSLRRLARWATRYGPLVMPIPDAGADASAPVPLTGRAAIVVDITGCDAVHRGDATLAARVLRDLHTRSIHAQVAIASTRIAALAASVVWPCRVLEQDPAAGAAALRDLPLWTLRLPAKTLEALREVNVRRIGEALALPRDGSADRFGPTLFAVLDALRGECEEAFEPLPHASPVEVELAFDGPTTRLEAIEAAVERTLVRFCTKLARRRRGVRLLEVALARVDALAIVETLALGRPSRNAKHLWTLLRPRIERVHMGFGIEGVKLRALVDARLAESQRRWAMSIEGRAGARNGAGGVTEFDESADGGGEDARRVGEMIDQLGARLGLEAVQVPSRARSAGQTALRPTVIFPRSMSAEVIAEGSEAGATAGATIMATPTAAPGAHRPREVRWAGGGGRVIECDGPERHSPKWWVERREEGGRARVTPERDLDCWRVRTADGRWLWLVHRRPDRWSVIGAWV